MMSHRYKRTNLYNGEWWHLKKKETIKIIETITIAANKSQ